MAEHDDLDGQIALVTAAHVVSCFLPELRKSRSRYPDDILGSHRFHECSGRSLMNTPVWSQFLGRLATDFNGRLGPWWQSLASSRGGWRRSENGSGAVSIPRLSLPLSIGTLLDDRIVDGSKATAEFSYHPRPFEDTVRGTVRRFEGSAHP